MRIACLAAFAMHRVCQKQLPVSFERQGEGLLSQLTSRKLSFYFYLASGLTVAASLDPSAAN
jgi:hypothetical protein